MSWNFIAGGVGVASSAFNRFAAAKCILRLFQVFCRLEGKGYSRCTSKEGKRPSQLPSSWVSMRGGCLKTYCIRDHPQDGRGFYLFLREIIELTRFEIIELTRFEIIELTRDVHVVNEAAERNTRF